MIYTSYIPEVIENVLVQISHDIEHKLCYGNFNLTLPMSDCIQIDPFLALQLLYNIL